LLWMGTATLVGPCSNHRDFVPDGQFYNEKGDFAASWKLLDTAIEIQFSLPGTAFIGMGIARPMPWHGSLMENADIVLGYVFDNQSVWISDYYSFQPGPPQEDSTIGGRDDVTPVCGQRSNGVTTLRYRRDLDTGDDYDHPFLLSANDMIYAWQNGEPGKLQFHGGNRNHVQIDFTKPDGFPDTDFGREESGLQTRMLVNQALTGHLGTIQTEAAGAASIHDWPYSTVVDIGDCDTAIAGAPQGSGAPFLLLSSMERSIINWKVIPKCSLSIQLPYTISNDTDAMMFPRTTLMGNLIPVPDAAVQDVRDFYLTKHPMAEFWIDFADFQFFQFNVSDLFVVAGFGNEHFIGWVDARTYLSHKLNATV